MANGKCIGILHNSCIDEKIEINTTIIIMKIAILHNEIPLLEIWNNSLYEIAFLIRLFLFCDILVKF